MLMNDWDHLLTKHPMGDCCPWSKRQIIARVRGLAAEWCWMLGDGTRILMVPPGLRGVVLAEKGWHDFYVGIKAVTGLEPWFDGVGYSPTRDMLLLREWRPFVYERPGLQAMDGAAQEEKDRPMGEQVAL